MPVHARYAEMEFKAQPCRFLHILYHALGEVSGKRADILPQSYSGIPYRWQNMAEACQHSAMPFISYTSVWPAMIVQIQLDLFGCTNTAISATLVAWEHARKGSNLIDSP